MFKTVCFIITLILISSSISKSLKTQSSTGNSVKGCNDFKFANIRYSDNRMVTDIDTACSKISGDGSSSITNIRFDLNKCIGNHNGSLRSGSNFGSICRECTIINTTLKCTCFSRFGVKTQTSIELSKVVENDNRGSLRCI